MSPVEVANLALSNLRIARSIESFDERTPAAEAAKKWYEICRDAVLQGSWWTFAKGYKVLAPSNDTPFPGWAYRYGLPVDCVLVRYLVAPEFAYLPPDREAVRSIQLGIYDRVPSNPFELMAAESGDAMDLVTNIAPAGAIYTRRITNINVWSPTAIQGLGHHLAAKMGPELNQKLEIQKVQEQLYAGVIGAAEGIDANQETQQRPPEAEWIRHR